MLLPCAIFSSCISTEVSIYIHTYIHNTHICNFLRRDMSYHFLPSEHRTDNIHIIHVYSTIYTCILHILSVLCWFTVIISSNWIFNKPIKKIVSLSYLSTFHIRCAFGILSTTLIISFIKGGVINYQPGGVCRDFSKAEIKIMTPSPGPSKKKSDHPSSHMNKTWPPQPRGPPLSSLNPC